MATIMMNSNDNDNENENDENVEAFTNYPSSGGSSLLNKGRLNYFAPY